MSQTTKRKDVKAFIESLKKSKSPSPKSFIKSLKNTLDGGETDFEKGYSLEHLKKGLQIFRKSCSSYLSLETDQDTVKELLENWDLHSEKFHQILFAVEQISKSRKS